MGMKMIMSNEHEVGQAIKDNIIPFAVRWYTGEAAPERDDDDEDDDDDDDEDDDDDDEESSDDDDAKYKKPTAKKGAAKSGAKKASPKLGAADAPKEECKQQ